MFFPTEEFCEKVLFFSFLVGGAFCEFKLWENIVSCQVREEIYANQERGVVTLLNILCYIQILKYIIYVR